MSCSLALSAPVITLPSLQTGRQVAAAALREMNMPQLMAVDTDEYVTTAVRLAKDSVYREQVKRLLAERSELLNWQEVLVDRGVKPPLRRVAMEQKSNASQSAVQEVEKRRSDLASLCIEEWVQLIHRAAVRWAATREVRMGA